MKLFFGTNSATSKTKNIKLLYAAINSALQNTDFEIFVVFDGKKHELNLPTSVEIIEHRHRCYDFFYGSERCKKNVGVLNTATGAFLRTEIPHILKKLQFKDEYCLYTDYDVIFQKGNYEPLKKISTKTIAVAPERVKEDKTHFNSGVMIMNIDFFIQNDQEIISQIKNTFDVKTSGYDQPILNDFFYGKFESLPLEFNWKVYWGINENAKIIHFHGAKPKVIEPDWRYNLPQIKKLREQDVVSYEFYNKIFESYLD